MGQFKALANKNWIIYKRNIFGSILEIVIPIAFILFTILIRNLAKVTVYNEQSNLSNSSLTYPLYGNPVIAVPFLNIGVPTILKYILIYLGTAAMEK